MHISVIKKNNIEIAVVNSDDLLIRDVQSALDLVATVDYETGCSRMIIDKSSICEEFFDLSTKMAGEVLQKFINYRKKIAIIGDFTKYPSRSLKVFIYECNKGKDIFFLPDEAQAIEKLSMV